MIEKILYSDVLDVIHGESDCQLPATGCEEDLKTSCLKENETRYLSIAIK